MGTFSIWHWLVVLAVIVLVFGTKKLRTLGGDLGAAVRGFKQGMREDEQTTLEDKDGKTDSAPINATATDSTANSTTATDNTQTNKSEHNQS